jgi:hypothetical protein
LGSFCLDDGIANATCADIHVQVNQNSPPSRRAVFIFTDPKGFSCKAKISFVRRPEIKSKSSYQENL